jgi:hypothetical protein
LVEDMKLKIEIKRDSYIIKEENEERKSILF